MPLSQAHVKKVPSHIFEMNRIEVQRKICTRQCSVTQNFHIENFVPDKLIVCAPHLDTSRPDLARLAAFDWAKSLKSFNAASVGTPPSPTRPPRVPLPPSPLRVNLYVYRIEDALVLWFLGLFCASLFFISFVIVTGQRRDACLNRWTDDIKPWIFWAIVFHKLVTI